MKAAGLGAALLAALWMASGWGRDQRREDALQAFWDSAGARTGQEVTTLMELPPPIRESSGLVASRLNPGLFWTHNDSGGDAVLYALWPEAGRVSEVRLGGAEARDWEDMDEGPCPDGGTGRCLYVGDIGDNLGLRSSVTVLVVREPEMGSRREETRTVGWEAVALRYPEGPRDAEALIVSDSGVVRIVTKGREGEHGIYRAPASSFLEPQGEPLRLTYEGRLPLAPFPWLGRVVTAGADIPGGIAVRTYTEVYFFRFAGGAWEAVAPPCVVAQLPPTGEGLDVGSDGLVYISSEATRSEPGRLRAADCGPL